MKSAVAQPQASFGGTYAHDGLFAMAAAYLFHIVSNHPFVDGNKRAGLLAAQVFLDVNGVSLEHDSESFYALTMGRRSSWVRCAVYTRQSVRRAGDDPAVSSCAIQRTLCTEFIRNKTWNFWYLLAERYDDEGESGATIERPGLAKLLRRIEEGDVRRVIVYRVDRLTRKLADLARLAAFFERHRVGLTIVAGNIDADAGSLAGLQVNMLATFAEWERENIRERIADTRGAIKARGESSAGRVPLGYRTDRLTKQLVIDERGAVTVRWVFDEAANGTTTNELVAKANKKKLASKPWTSRTTLRLLTNATYVGRRPDGAPGMHAAIVTPALFERVQALIEGRRKVSRYYRCRTNGCAG